MRMEQLRRVFCCWSDGYSQTGIGATSSEAAGGRLPVIHSLRYRNMKTSLANCPADGVSLPPTNDTNISIWPPHLLAHINFFWCGLSGPLADMVIWMEAIAAKSKYGNRLTWADRTEFQFEFHSLSQLLFDCCCLTAAGWRPVLGRAPNCPAEDEKDMICPFLGVRHWWICMWDREEVGGATRFQQRRMTTGLLRGGETASAKDSARASSCRDATSISVAAAAAPAVKEFANWISKVLRKLYTLTLQGRAAEGDDVP